MSFSALRTPLRSAAANPLRRAAQLPKGQFRSNFNRKFSTPPPPPPAKSSTGLYLGVGALAAAGLGYYFYATESGKEAATAGKSGLQAAKVKANFVPTKEDYIKVVIGSLLRH